MEEIIDISKVMNLLKRYWKFIVGLSLLGALTAAVISFFFIRPTYSASTQILVNGKDNNQPDFQATQTDLQLINTYNEIIKSPVILEKVSQNLKVDNNLASKISVLNSTQSKVITISAQSGNYNDAAKIVNETAKVFSDEVGKIMNTDNVTILMKAKENLDPSPIKPKPLINIVIGFILGMFVGLMYTILKNFLDKRIRTEEDVQEFLGLPVIGIIRHFDESK